ASEDSRTPSLLGERANRSSGRRTSRAHELGSGHRRRSRSAEGHLEDRGTPVQGPAETIEQVDEQRTDQEDPGDRDELYEHVPGEQRGKHTDGELKLGPLEVLGP